MVTFRNNNTRRSNFRRSDRNFKNTNERTRYGSNFSSNENFKRKVPGRNNHNASKLIEKYNDLAREASSNGDKILSENYFQHADHFTRIQNEQDNYKRIKFEESKEVKSEITTKQPAPNDISQSKVGNDKDVLVENNKENKNQPEVV
tara:strand:+ start:305 stop:745 length:441 start_codon:yes stop_codon:yes gene_type:complete